LLPLAFLATLWGVDAAPLALAGHPGPGAAPAGPDWPRWLPFLSCGAGAALLVCSRRAPLVLLSLTLLSATLGLLRATVGAGEGPPSQLARRMAQGPVVALRGEVVEPPLVGERSQRLRLTVLALRTSGAAWEPATGGAQVTVRPAPVIRAGELLQVMGQAEAPPAGAGGGSGRGLRGRGVDAVLAFPLVERLGPAPGRSPWVAGLERLRERLGGNLGSLLPEPHAALVSGMLLGHGGALPSSLVERLARSGTSHLVAVSGYNVGLVVAVAVSALKGLTGGRPGAVGLVAGASAALWGFVALVGPSGSVLRAAAMAQLALAGQLSGRHGGPGPLLLWGSALLAAWRPDVVHDPGWQLSFLGTGGLIWLGPLFAAGLGPLPRTVREALGATLAAQVSVLPALAVTFGQVSLVAPLANLLALPLVGPIMLGGAATSIAATVVPPLAPLLAGLTWAPTAALLHVISWTAALPWAAAPLPPWPRGAAGAYLGALLAACAFAQWWATRPGSSSESAPTRDQRGTGAGGVFGTVTGEPTLPVPALAGGTLLALSVAGCAMAGPHLLPRATEVLAIDVPAVPDGGLALVRTPRGERLLLNGGPGAGWATTLLGEHLRPWDRLVDAVLVGSPHDRYVQGLPRVISRYRPVAVLDAAAGVAGPGQAAYADTLAAARRHGVERRPLPAGSSATVGRDLRLTALPTPALPAVHLSWGEVSLLIPGDDPARLWPPAAGDPSPPRADVLLLEARWANAGATDALIRAVRPALVVVQGESRPAHVNVAAPAAPGQARTREEGGAGTLPWAYDRGPRWHHTARDGPLLLEARGGREPAFRVNGGPWRPLPYRSSGGGR
jgi:competence protein ComEC